MNPNPPVLLIDGQKSYSLEALYEVALLKRPVSLSPNLLNIRQEDRPDSAEPVYGLDTGVGDLCKADTGTQSKSLQEEILLSHACAIGDYLSLEQTRAILFHRLVTLSMGHSAVRPQLLSLLCSMLNKDLIPKVRGLGSTGTSDLGILAECFAVLLDEGELWKFEGQKPSEVFKTHSINTVLPLENREGLALINGHSAANALTILTALQAKSFLQKAFISSGLALEAFRAKESLFATVLEEAEQSHTHKITNRYIREILVGSTLIDRTDHRSESGHLQDPIAYRCIPQELANLYGATKALLELSEIELNTVVDNPLYDPNCREYISVGVFHRPHIAAALDRYNAALASFCGSICARMNFMTNEAHNKGLPIYLFEQEQISFGVMIPIYAAKSVLTEIQASSFPRSVFQHSVANDWENISSNSLNAAQNTAKLLGLAHEILGVDLLLSMQARALRRGQHANWEESPSLASYSHSLHSHFQQYDLQFPLNKTHRPTWLLDLFRIWTHSEFERLIAKDSLISTILGPSCEAPE